MVTKEEVKNAIEYKWRGKQVKTYLILWAVLLLTFLVVMVCTTITGDMRWNDRALEILGSVMAVVGSLYSLAVLPFALYSAYRQWEMLRNCGRFERYWVKLDEPNTSWNYRQAVGYRVVFTSENGEKLARYTKPLFSSSAFSGFQLADYNNKTVEIFYDPDQDQVILAGKAK